MANQGTEIFERFKNKLESGICEMDCCEDNIAYRKGEIESLLFGEERHSDNCPMWKLLEIVKDTIREQKDRDF